MPQANTARSGAAGLGAEPRIESAVRPQVIPATRVRATPHLLPTMANLIFGDGDSHLLKTSPLDYQQLDFPRDAHPSRKIKDNHRTAAPVTLPHFFITSLQILVQTALSPASGTRAPRPRTWLTSRNSPSRPTSILHVLERPCPGR